MINTIIDLGSTGVIIDTLAARSDTPDGIRIMKKGFTEVPSTTYARNFIIKVRESGMPFAQEYRFSLKVVCKAQKNGYKEIFNFIY